MRTLKMTAMSLVIGLGLVTAATAQSAKTGPNGGMVAGKDGHEAELVVSPTEISIYLIDGGKSQPIGKSAVRAVVQQDGKTTTIALTSVENKRLVGALAAPLAKGAIVVLTGKDDHGHGVSARFVVN